MTHAGARGRPDSYLGGEPAAMPFPTRRAVVLALTLIVAGCGESSTTSLLRMGDSIRAAGDPDTAVTFYQRAATEDPHNPQPMIKLGDAMVQSGDPVRAAS